MGMMRTERTFATSNSRRLLCAGSGLCKVDDTGGAMRWARPETTVYDNDLMLWCSPSDRTYLFR